MAMKRTKQFIKDYPSHIVFLSLLTMIGCVTAILALPICRTTDINLIDLIFTATSLTTVTGSLTIPLSSFSTFGHGIMIVIMQICGLGIMTMSLFLISLFLDLGLYTQIFASEILSIQSFKDVKRILLFIIKLTFICEIIGSIITFYVIRYDYTLDKAMFLSIFHAVASFCNVGISLFPYEDLTYNTNILMTLNTSLLTLFGCLGFITWHELIKYIKNWNNHRKLSWNTRLTLKVFFSTMAISSILFWLLERNNTLKSMPIMQFLSNMILVGIGTKCAGWLPVDINFVHPATIFLLAITAFIGAAPSSTGGGIKTGALAIFLAVIKSTIYGKSHIEIKGRSIPRDQIYKGLAIISLACSCIVIITFCLLITEQKGSFLDILFETISNFANNGMSSGMTPLLTTLGKILIAITMIIGRIGALTLIIGMRKSSDIPNISYPEERVILG